MKLVSSQQILLNPSLRWGSSFIFVTGIYACLVLVVLNKPSTPPIILAPLTNAVMIDLPPLATMPEATLQSIPEPEPEPEPKKYR